MIQTCAPFLQAREESWGTLTEDVPMQGRAADKLQRGNKDQCCAMVLHRIQQQAPSLHRRGWRCQAIYMVPEGQPGLLSSSFSLALAKTSTRQSSRMLPEFLLIYLPDSDVRQ